MSCPKIAVDIDDVLSRNAEDFAAFSNERWKSNITPDHYSEDWASAWGVTYDVASERAKELHETGFFGAHRHFAAAVPVLTRLRSRYDLVVITSRRRVIKPETDVWIEKHFPGIFSAVHYAGIWDDTEQAIPHRLQRTKADMCRELQVDFLIDDQIKHCLAAAECGIETLLFGEYSWNRSSDLPARVIRVSSWQDVGEFFDAKS